MSTTQGGNTSDAVADKQNKSRGKRKRTQEEGEDPEKKNYINVNDPAIRPLIHRRPASSRKKLKSLVNHCFNGLAKLQDYQAEIARGAKITFHEDDQFRNKSSKMALAIEGRVIAVRGYMADGEDEEVLRKLMNEFLVVHASHGMDAATQLIQSLFNATADPRLQELVAIIARLQSLLVELNGHHPPGHPPPHNLDEHASRARNHIPLSHHLPPHNLPPPSHLPVGMFDPCMLGNISVTSRPDQSLSFPETTSSEMDRRIDGDVVQQQVDLSAATSTTTAALRETEDETAVMEALNTGTAESVTAFTEGNTQAGTETSEIAVSTDEAGEATQKAAVTLTEKTILTFLMGPKQGPALREHFKYFASSHAAIKSLQDNVDQFRKELLKNRGARNRRETGKQPQECTNLLSLLLYKTAASNLAPVQLQTCAKLLEELPKLEHSNISVIAELRTAMNCCIDDKPAKVTQDFSDRTARSKLNGQELLSFLNILSKIRSTCSSKK